MPEGLTDTDLASAFRERTIAREAQFLSDLAVCSYPAERRVAEPDSQVRTPFQRDRDRIVHSKSFRRLKQKTQVFIAPEGDHFRTRLTHTLEACGVARTVARALRLNEDLTEAIGLGHDLGHPPFGHIGEAVLSDCLEENFGRKFKHNEHSLRMVEALERDGAGLNLTAPVRNGILCHTGPVEPETLEGKIVRIVDRIAYINHDIDDAMRAGVLRADDLPANEIALLGATPSERIDTLVLDLIETSNTAGDIAQSEEIGGAMLRLRKFMFDNVYLGPAVRNEQQRVETLLRALFMHFVDHPELLPVTGDDVSGGDVANHLNHGEPEAGDAAIATSATTGDSDELAQRITDWIAGMTDRYAIRTFSELSIPKAGPA